MIVDMMEDQIIKEVQKIGRKFEDKDKNYIRLMGVIEEIKRDPTGVSKIDEVEEIYNDRTDLYIFFFKKGIEFAVKRMLSGE